MSASGTITLDIGVDAAAGAVAKQSVWGHISGGTGSALLTNYMVRNTGQSGFTHTGSASTSIADSTLSTPLDINSLWTVNGSGWNDTVRFDGNTTPNVIYNGLSLDGTSITGKVTVDTTAIGGAPDVTADVTLTGRAVPTLYNLAQMNSYIYGDTTVVPTGWTVTSDDATTGGYRALVFANDDDFSLGPSNVTEVVIDVRGTANAANQYADLSFYDAQPNPLFASYVYDTAKLLADTKLAFPGAHITLTGHSLGGSLVQLVGNASHYSTVAFDAPGAMQYYSTLSEIELKPAIELGEENGNWEANVDIRPRGDGFSLIHKQDTINLMTLVSGVHLHDDTESQILNNHKMDALLAELAAPGTVLGFGAIEGNADVLAFGNSSPAAPIRLKAAEAIKKITADAGLQHRFIDPDSGTQIIFQETNSSPLLTSVDFLADPAIGSYKVWALIDGTWSATQTVVAGTTASFATGTRAIKIEALSPSNQPVALPNGFLFGANFATTDRVTADVHAINFDDFSGANTQTVTAGQTTLNVNSSFNYSDAGNFNLIVNGTASDDDTILLGAGNKTVNLGSGNDLVAVRPGLTGNIVIHGGAGGNTVLAGAANVTLIAGTGDILFIGGDDANANVGSNTIDYSAFTAAVNVNLSTGVIQTSNGAIETLLNVENVTGSPFADHITGDSRANVLNGGAGNDILTGGGGNDRFVFTPGSGVDTINDFVAGPNAGDSIDLTAFGHLSLEIVLSHTTQVGSDAVIDFGNGTTITLHNISKANLSRDDFVLLTGTTPRDFNADGTSDILWHNDNGATSIWDSGQLGGAHIIAAAGVVPSSYHIVGIGDFDGNGKSDLLWQNDNGLVSIWDNAQLGGAHVIANAGVVPSGWHVAGVGDFDGNGKSDILWQNDNGTVSIWDNGQIAGAHIVANAGVVPGSFHIAGIGDFDGNGKSDILWRNDNGQISIWDNGQIAGAHIVANAGVVPSSYRIAGTGDFDGNGKSDILWQNDNGLVSIWDNGQLGGAHVVANAGVVPSSFHIAGTGDFDGNGKSDILWRNDSGATSIWDNGQLAGAHVIANAGAVDGTWHIV